MSGQLFWVHIESSTERFCELYQSRSDRGLSITPTTKGVFITESTMDDKTYRYPTRATAGEAIAFAKGYPITTVVLVGKPNDFGGATSNAGLLVLGGRPKAGAQRGGFFARGNTVFYLICQN